MINIAYNPRKATQAAGYLLFLGKGRINYTKLIKLLYLSDRESLRRYGDSLTTDAPYSMDNGPVLSNIYNHIKKSSEDYWNQFIERDDYDVKLKKRTPLGELSTSEIEILEEIYQQFGSMEVWDLVAYCHKNLMEWQDPEGSSNPIHIEKMLKVLGKSKKEISIIEEEINSYENVKSILSS